MGYNQIKILLYVKQFLYKYKKKKFSPYFNIPFYLHTYSNSIGSNVLKKISKVRDHDPISGIIWSLKDITSCLNYTNASIHYSKIDFNYKNIFVTWAFKNNFKKNGKFIDKFFNVDSKKLKNSLWFVIYMDNKIPKKIPVNVIILNKGKKSFNLIIILNLILKNLIFLFKDFNYFLSLISNFNFFSQIIIKKIKPFIKKDIDKLIMPYEGQPFQNLIIKDVRKIALKVKTIGYIHSPPLALPANFMRKSFSPDQLIVNGKDQLYCFNRYLGWKKNQLKILPSFRFIKTKKINQNFIYLPFALKNSDIIMKSLKYLSEKKIIDIKKFKIKGHPLSSSTKKISDLVRSFNRFKANAKGFNNKSNKKLLIFIGSSGAIIEALEKGSKVMQIAEVPEFDLYSNTIWPNIERKKIINNIYEYSLKKKGNLISFGKKKNEALNLLKL